jgi:hypothetical protein
VGRNGSAVDIIPTRPLVRVGVVGGVVGGVERLAFTTRSSCPDELSADV